MIASLYRKMFPYTFRKKVYDFFLGDIVFFFRNLNVITRSKLTFLFGFFLPKTEINKAYAFIGRYGITSYPHEYSLDYYKKKITVERDTEKNLPYVNHHDRRLYFPELYTDEMVEKNYRSLLIEQDMRSAHRYVRSYNELQNRTLLDVGAAEGIFSLDTIEFTKQVILFECLEQWEKPLKATFAKWANKVTFVKKYVGDRSTEDFVTIDEFLSGREKNELFIKMDIEGAERAALNGAKKTLGEGKNIQLAVCTYHRKGDPEYIESLMKSLGYSCEFTDGLMYWNKRLSIGLIRCKN